MHLPHSHHHPHPLKSLTPHLLLHLPYSLPLLRIIQHTAFNPDARIFSTLKPDDHVDPQQTWAAVYVERSRFPETECWLFSTLESWVSRRGGRGSNGSTDSDAKGELGRREAEARAHMLSVLNDVAVHSSSSLHTGTLPTPNTPLILGTLNDALLPLLAGSDFPTLKPVEVLTREVVNVAVDGQPAQEGTLLPLAPTPSSSSNNNTTTTTTNGKGGIILGYCKPVHKFLIPPPPLAAAPSAPTNTTPPSSSLLLPPGYTFTTTLHHQPTDLALAVSRSEIPRTVAGLRKLGGVGVRFCPDPPVHHPLHQDTTTITHPSPSSSPTPPRPEEASSSSSSPQATPKEEGERDRLVAWLFLSPDGSLQSLHVEVEHRGKGLAKAVCRVLMERLREVPEEVGMRSLETSRRGMMIGGGLGDHDDDDNGIAAAMKEVRAEGWAHSDVLEHNADGAGVARGIGGKAGWRVRWVGVDLERVRRVCASLSA